MFNNSCSILEEWMGMRWELTLVKTTPWPAEAARHHVQPHLSFFTAHHNHQRNAILWRMFPTRTTQPTAAHLFVLTLGKQRIPLCKQKMLLGPAEVWKEQATSRSLLVSFPFSSGLHWSAQKMIAFGLGVNASQPWWGFLQTLNQCEGGAVRQKTGIRCFSYCGWQVKCTKNHLNKISSRFESSQLL